MAQEAEKKPPVEDSETLKQVEEAFLDSQSWLPEFVQPYWQDLQQYPWVLVIVVLAAGYVLAKSLQWLFSTVASSLSKRTKNSYDDKLIGIVSKSIFSIVFFIFMMFAVDAFQFAPDTAKLLKRIIMSVLFISLMITALKGSKVLLEALDNSERSFSFIEKRTLPILNIVSQLILIGAFSYFLILLWGKDPTAWLASAGVVGIAIGFAAKDTLANLFAGFFIVADSPYKIGDYIILDTGERGQVTHVGIRSTRLMTRDDVEITIPNSVMGNAKIVNESGGPSEKSRLRVPVGVSYDTDLEVAVEALKQVADDNERVCKFPTPRVRAKTFGASSIDFELYVWIEHPETKGLVMHDLIMAIHKEFNNRGIEIPYSKQDLYIKNLDKPVNENLAD